MTWTVVTLPPAHRNMLACHEAAFGTDWHSGELGVEDGNTVQKEIPDLDMDTEKQLYLTF